MGQGRGRNGYDRAISAPAQPVRRACTLTAIAGERPARDRVDFMMRGVGVAACRGAGRRDTTRSAPPPHYEARHAACMT